ncbi:MULTISPECIES: hypothetical protein [unclassified Frankia]
MMLSITYLLLHYVPMAAGWMINIAVAEWIIRKRLTNPPHVSTHG